MSTSAYRRSMIAGIVFVALFVVAVFTALNAPESQSSDSAATVGREWVDYLSDSGHRVQHVIGGYVLVFAGLAFIWFCLGLREAIEARAGADSRITGRLLSSLAVFGAAALASAGMVAADVSGAVSLGGEAAPQTGDAVHWITELAFPLMFVVFGITSAAVIAVVSSEVLRVGALPRWTAYFGVLGVLGGLGAAVFLPMLLPLLWFLAVAVVGVARPLGAVAPPSPA